MNRYIFFEADTSEEEGKTNRKERDFVITKNKCLSCSKNQKNNNSSKFRSHPGDDLHDDPGARLLQHGHGQVVGDALQAVAVHG